MDAVLIDESYWANSQLSIARYYGQIKINGKIYKLVNKHGITLQELSSPQSKYYVRSGKAIPPGEPADLVLVSWISTYRKLGREKLIELLKQNKTLAECKRIAKEVKDESK